MNYYSILGLIIFSVRLLSFITRFKHYISLLLSLEIIALGVFLSFSRILLIKGRERFILLPFLTIVVCEGRIGLSLLVIITRFFGSDNLKITNLTKI